LITKPIRTSTYVKNVKNHSKYTATLANSSSCPRLTH